MMFPQNTIFHFWKWALDPNLKWCYYHVKDALRDRILIISDSISPANDKNGDNGILIITIFNPCLINSTEFDGLDESNLLTCFALSGYLL